MSTVNLARRTQDACNQLTRYFGGVANEELLAVLEKLTDINDALHQGNDPAIVRRACAEARRLLDLLAISTI
jgi:hypothetical protein